MMRKAITTVITILLMSSVVAAQDISSVTVTCLTIEGANIVRVEGLDPIQLIGVKPPDKDSKYYDKAEDYLKGKLKGEKIRVEVDPDLPKTNDGSIRAVVYYKDGEKWINVGIDLIEKGYAKVVIVPGSYVDTKVYLKYEKEARNDERGIWKDWKKNKSTLDLEAE